MIKLLQILSKNDDLPHPVFSILVLKTPAFLLWHV